MIGSLYPWMKPVRRHRLGRKHGHQEAKQLNFTLLNFMSLATAEVCGVKILWLNATGDFIGIRDLSLRGESDLRSDFSPGGNLVVQFFHLEMERHNFELF